MPTDYTLIDATLEILLMLLAAFLLGWLFCWLMKKIFGRKPQAAHRQKQRGIDEPAISGTDRSGIVSSNRERFYGADADLNLDTEAPDVNQPKVNLNEVDLPKSPTIERPTVDIDANSPEITKSRPRIDLPGLNTPDLNIKDKLDTGIGAGKSALGKGVGAATAGIGALAVGASAFKDKAVDKVESLDVGVNTPEIERPDLTLSQSDISIPEADIDLPDVERVDFETELDLPNVERTSFDTEVDLPEIPEIQAASVNTDGIDVPSTDVPKVDLDGNKSAVSGTFESGKEKLKGLGSAGLGAGAAGIGAIAAGASSLKESAVDKVGDLGDKLTRPDLPGTSAEPTTVSDGRIDYSHTEADDLTRISGIDAQVVDILNKQGIHSYQDLQGTNRTQLKEYLDATGDSKLRSLEPASWPHQATLCANRNWSKLSEYQSFLTGSNLDTRQAIPSYGVTEGDDLKKVEGIGPFFESLLNDAGITTYEQLKNSDRDSLKEIIDAAGPDYRMHEPETWPYQAGLAYRGEWKKLQDYIQFMTGRS